MALNTRTKCHLMLGPLLDLDDLYEALSWYGGETLPDPERAYLRHKLKDAAKSMRHAAKRIDEALKVKHKTRMVEDG